LISWGIDGIIDIASTIQEALAMACKPLLHPSVSWELFEIFSIGMGSSVDNDKGREKNEIIN